MLLFLFRYFTTTICINNTYHKLLNKDTKRSLTILLSTISFIIGSVFYFLPAMYSFVVPIIYILLLYLAIIFNDTETPATTFTTLILSYSISYICYFFIVIIISTIFSFIFTFYNKRPTLLMTTLQVVISLIQYLLCTLIFHSKQLRNGIPYLRNTFFSQLGVFIGILIIGLAMYFSTMNSSENTVTSLPYSISCFAFFLLSFLIYFWWKNISYQSYLVQAKERECNRLKEHLSCCQENLKLAEKENAELSKLIHRDNKLIPSLQLAVHDLLTEICEDEKNNSLSQTANRLLIQLNIEMEERKGLLTHLSQDRKKLPDTEVPSFNQLLSYIQQRCMEHTILFDCNFSDDIPSVLTDNNYPSEKELSILLADMLENALISTIHNKGERIFLLIEKELQEFRIEIWDSGHKFSKDVLYHIGKKRYTTHKSEGGSGIGLMVTWELLKKYQASLIIDEEITTDNFFTKKMIIRFDHKNNYILCSQRSAEDLNLLKQRQDLQINIKY